MASYRDWISRIDIEIDYYSAFIKAWIAFNSWYRSEYTDRTDRAIIERLKSQSNRFKSYIETLLDPNNNSEESTKFKSDLDTVIKVFAHMLQEVSVGGTKAEYVFTGVNPIVSNSSISFVLVL